jgi:hypothetical protein
MQTNPFATEAAEYAHLRPTYTDELFAFLATVVPSRRRLGLRHGQWSGRNAPGRILRVGHGDR